MDLIVENGGYVGIGIADPVTRLHVLGADGDGNEEQIGFIAQEVREIVPEVVSGVEGSMGIAYGHITAVLVKALQEQQAQIEKLQAEVKRLGRRTP